MSVFAGVSATEVLSAAMKVADYNHRVIANNIANADTPGYDPVELDFQQTLRNVIEADGRTGLRPGQAGGFGAFPASPVLKSLASASTNDYNKVDIDAELANLSENTTNFVVYSALLAKRFGEIKSVLSSLQQV